MTYTRTKKNNKNIHQFPDKILSCRGKIRILKYKSINNVKKGNNTLYAWKINDIMG